MLYLYHFDVPYHHAQHYLGWTENLAQRHEQHLSGNGSPLIKAAIQAGIPVSLVWTFPGDRYLEQLLKWQHNNRRICPVCRGKKNENC